MTAERRPCPPGPNPLQHWPGDGEAGAQHVSRPSPAGFSVSTTTDAVLVSHWPSLRTSGLPGCKGRRFKTFRPRSSARNTTSAGTPKAPGHWTSTHRVPRPATCRHPTPAVTPHQLSPHTSRARLCSSGPLLNAIFSMRSFKTADLRAPPSRLHPAAGDRPHGTHVHLCHPPTRDRDAQQALMYAAAGARPLPAIC